jgi:hypothetical protein
MYREWELPQAEVRCGWSVDATTGGWWTQPATEFWGLGFSSTADGVEGELVGPPARPQRFEMQAGDRFWGVELQAHVFLSTLPKSSFELVQVLPSTSNTFRLGERTTRFRTSTTWGNRRRPGSGGRAVDRTHSG